MSEKKLSTPIAIKEYSKLNLDSVHVTTANFMDFNVAKTLELVPKQSVNIQHTQFTRLDPMIAPTFGESRAHNKYFFVPFRTVMPAWNDFINDVAHTFSSGVIEHVPSVPVIYNSAFYKLFTTTSLGLANMVKSPVPLEQLLNNSNEKYMYDNFDFVMVNDAVAVGFNLTAKGVRIMKILQSLGYTIDFKLSNFEDTTGIFHSALPLLCLLRVYMDWYYPSTYIQDDDASFVTSLLTTDTGIRGDQGYYDEFVLERILSIIDRVCYDADFLVSAWDNPVAPTSGSYSNIDIYDPTTSSYGGVATQPNGTPALTDTPNSDSSSGDLSNLTKPVTQFMINSLRKLSDFMKRNQLSGARVLDRYLSRFGIALPAAKLNRSEFLGEFKFDIRFGDVTNMNGAPDSELGSYAGKGIGSGNGSINYTATEYGMLLCVSTIITKQSYFQGADRSTMHFTKLDFWTPEFDSLGVQAISQREVYVPMNSLRQIGLNQDEGLRNEQRGRYDYDDIVFGFTSRYGEYKRRKDMLTGDFRLGSRNTLLKSWHLMRDLDPFFAYNGVTATHHDQNFLEGTDADQYSRIFYSSDENEEHFKIIHMFKIDSQFPGKPLFDSYEFEDEDKSKHVNIEIGGVKAN